ncbi:glycoside hydrolase family 43 protein [Alkalitalea saponilacus]|uniref:Beta-xylosidase n=1 Tax=Alkalitalea saponilacus TaxID=889453 RepID=A0A1T5HTR6_9BACT|nr:glycoside hydrolase 43 family protein [Alkalitalea saponilacus]ASB49979.1 glycoside hydrolase [Alkalitalea saponilacus]SKC24066.1 Beta-xylosidase [Alkalitalea saponilacus]
MKRNLFTATFLILILAVSCSTQKETPMATNPIIFADVPDIAIVRVGDAYYMSSTTMHMSPGLPIMRSYDLVNWELVSYAYDILIDNEMMRLENGQESYGFGSWASSMRFHDGVYYVSTFAATSGKTHIYTTTDIENGEWQEISFEPDLHDHTLFFDDDGRIYMIYACGELRLVELKPDLSGIIPGSEIVVIEDASSIAGEHIGLCAEGSQLLKHEGMYYLFNIVWPVNDMRTVLVHRADNIAGPYEGRVILKDRGIAQGSLIDTPEGDWYAYMFRDHGAVGRIPYLMPVDWVDGWPVLGIDGKVPDTLDIPAGDGGISGIVASDDFVREPGDEKLPLVWQWNHNPDHRFWSLSDRPGYLRLITGRVDANVLQARNTLTQRTFGPQSSAYTRMEIGNMNNGDCAGLIALQRDYGFVGVRKENDKNYLVLELAENNNPQELERVLIDQDHIYLRIDCDFEDMVDLAYFYYSLDGNEWIRIGKPLQMVYTLIHHFMGYRFGLFNYATETAGGYVDFDFFKVNDEIINPY